MAVAELEGAFADLSEPLRDLLASEGFLRPTAAQEAAIPSILSGAHTLLVAPTGMGKTESAMLPLLDRLVRARLAGERRKGVQILYVTPLRALNRDLMGRLHEWGKRLGVDVRVRHGDTTGAERARQARHPPDVLITTPETVQIMFTGRLLRAALANVRHVVVDEVHELAEDERGAQLACGLERLEALQPAGFQRVGLSATVGDPEEVAAWLGGAGRTVRIVRVPVAKRLSLSVESPRPSARDVRTAEKLASRPDAAAFLNRCLALVDQHAATLLFVNTRETAEVLAARVRMLDPEYPLAIHHGSLARDVRIAAEESFKQGRSRGLVCTSSMELGIDIGQADLVIQYGSPRQVTRLVQRVGRAGHRADLVSNGVVVALDPDDVLEAAVIVRRTLDEKIEAHPGPRMPLDVLANQLVMMAVERGRVAGRDAWRVLRRAHPLRDLKEAEVEEVLAQLAEESVLWAEKGEFGPRRRSRTYMVENLSMIRDEKTWRVRNIVTNRPVAQLDEAFVASFVEPSAAFILQGRAWRVVEIKEDEIVVEPVQDPLGAVPSWVGEEIPVPFEVAEDVGALRAALAAAPDLDAAARTLVDEHRCDLDGATKAAAYVRSQLPRAVPTDKVLTLEYGGGVAVLNAAFGSRVNETLGRLLSTLLSARLGTSVGLQIDPYRIVLNLPSRADARVVAELLTTTPPASVRPLLELVLQNSVFLRHRMLHVARKFGAIERDVDFRKISIARLLGAFKGTPLYREALREVFEDHLDLPGTERQLAALQRGDLTLVEQDLGPISIAGIDQRIELISPARADRTMLEALEKRLGNERVVLHCLHCKDWRVETRVDRAIPPDDSERKLACPDCASVLVTAYRPWQQDPPKVLAKARRSEDGLDPDERKELRRLHTAANLLLDHKRRAMLALVARGVGPDTAGRLLYKQRTSDETFLRDVLEAEITYAKTRQFWD
ncbi:MAG TPA: DEAD/DEAH box helicase [Candidatus Thermoplasmatota archaeon]|nr:DEAD/DEAH box helicase [Candidatus Thermoplasmatota archaeon]